MEGSGSGLNFSTVKSPNLINITNVYIFVAGSDSWHEDADPDRGAVWGEPGLRWGRVREASRRGKLDASL